GCFFFQAADGIRDRNVTGVQTCALPISEIYPICAQSSYVTPYGVLDFDRLDIGLHYLFINGVIVGYVTNARLFTADLRKHRRKRSEERRVGKECRCRMMGGGCIRLTRTE